MAEKKNAFTEIKERVQSHPVTAQGIKDYGKDIWNLFLGGSTKIAQDVGKAGQERGVYQAEEATRQKTKQFSQEALNRAMKEQDPEKKARLLTASRMFSEMAPASATPEAGYSEDINKPYWQRALKSGTEIATTAALVSALPSLLQSTGKFVAHPYATLSGAATSAANLVKNPAAAAQAIKAAIANPNTGKMTGTWTMPTAPVPQAPAQAAPPPTAPVAPTTPAPAGLPATPPVTPAPPTQPQTKFVLDKATGKLIEIPLPDIASGMQGPVKPPVPITPINTLTPPPQLSTPAPATPPVVTPKGYTLPPGMTMRTPEEIAAANQAASQVAEQSPGLIEKAGGFLKKALMPIVAASAAPLAIGGYYAGKSELKNIPPKAEAQAPGEATGVGPGGTMPQPYKSLGPKSELPELTMSPDELQTFRTAPKAVNDIPKTIGQVQKVNGQWEFTRPEQIVGKDGKPLLVTSQDANNLVTGLKNTGAEIDARIQQGDRSTGVLTASTYIQNEINRVENQGKIGDGLQQSANQIDKIQGDIANIRAWANEAPPELFNTIKVLNINELRASTDPAYGALQQYLLPLADTGKGGEAAVMAILNSASKKNFLSQVDTVVPKMIDEYHTRLRSAFGTSSSPSSTFEASPIEKIQRETGASSPEATQQYLQNLPMEGGSVQGFGQPFQMIAGGGGGLPSKPEKLGQKDVHKGLPKIPRRFEYR